MEIIEIKKENLVAAYEAASIEQKLILEKLYPKVFKNILEQIITITDACIALGIDVHSRHQYPMDLYEQAERDIEIFAEALREGKPASECFYYPYFNHSGGSGFSYYGCGDARVFSFVGARLRVDTPEKAMHLGKCMLEQYKTYIKG